MVHIWFVIHGSYMVCHTWFISIKSNNLNFRAFSGLFMGPQIKFGPGSGLGLRFRVRA